MAGKFGTLIESLEDPYSREPSLTTLMLLAQQAVKMLKPAPRCRWIRDEEGRIKMDPKPGKYMGDLPEVAGVWVYYEARGGGSGKELIRLGVEEEGGEFVLRAKRW